MIVVVDYGMGNLRSVSKALEKAGARVKVSSIPRDISRADKLVVPGVGAFKDAMAELKSRRLIEPIKEFTGKGKPFLGLCLGLQLIFSKSEEGGISKGLGLLKGKVVKFRSKRLKIPHMGWNQLDIKGNCPLLKGIPEGSYFYFVHSYYAAPADKRCVAAWTGYGVKFPSVVCSGNIYATQFHPEKSQELGLKILRNFVKL
ncbi:MAG: imidazole glycerol phosphate synthase subunit HisH [Candidatus Omnitrophica bacterium]|nr:imidazole glycerol phosphate synthase subunit HisH [Candidatus Omnitrophota bacterium]